MRLTVIVPARNEADVLEACLKSLLAQSEPGFALAGDWELLVVDDGSTDGTRSIALGLPGVNLLDPAPLKPGWTGKANAVWTAAGKARGEWRSSIPVISCRYVAWRLAAKGMIIPD